MLTEISPRALPEPTGATTDLDHAILTVLSDGTPREPREIFELIGAHDCTLQRVYARLRVLVSRKVLIRRASVGGPLRGPGAGVYTVA